MKQKVCPEVSREKKLTRHLVVPDEVRLRMILIKPKHKKKYVREHFYFFLTERQENVTLGLAV